MIAFEEAQRRIVAACAPLGIETVAIADGLGRVVAETLCARDDLVPFARSAMDGFAVRAADTAVVPARLPVRASVFAERSAPATHAAGTATAVATGAPIPAGADAVVPVEDVARENGAVLIARPVYAGTHVFPPGEDARAGDVLIAAGTPLSAAALGLLAAAGHAQVSVFKRPRVAVVTTGDELVALDTAPGYGQIRNSNGTLVSATVGELGGDVAGCEQARDEPEALRVALAVAADTCDLLIVTGGASVGERDRTKALLRELACTFVFDSVALRPAKPSAFGKLGSTFVAVLPGNPSSAFVGLHELVRPALLTLAGRSDPYLPSIPATLVGSVHGKAERTYAAYAALEVNARGFAVRPLDNQCSALTRTAADANGFIIVPPGRRDYADGDLVRVDVFAWPGTSSGKT